MNIAINGFGRIGRAAFKVLMTKKGVDVVAINDLGDIENLAYLLRYDSVYGRWKTHVSVKNGFLVVGNKKIKVLSERDPSQLPWKKMKVDVVIESTGVFTDAEGMSLHKKAGARYVMLSAPAKGDGVQTVMRGVDEHFNTSGLYSNASCTTNCISPIADVMQKEFGVLRAGLTTIHAYTSGQGLVDGPAPERKKDFRRGRAAAVNLIPTGTGAAQATTQVIPSLAGLFDGFAIRVPVACGSLSDLTFLVEKKTSVDEVNRTLARYARGKMKGILEVSDDPLVSSDIVGSTASAIVDAGFTQVIGGDFVKVLAWYDNEWGYAHRLVELSLLLGRTK